MAVLFEKTGGGQQLYRSADDDSGTDENAHLRYKFQRGSHYVLRIRVYYADDPDAMSVMMW